jgi:uncharacterized protein (TIGR02996 family)
MTDHNAFLQAILTDPEADTPRLVYADWLEEQGDPRGEFIRLQCELARLAEEFQEPPELVQREKELLALHGATWRQPLRKILGRAELPFSRGFVERLSLPAEKFINAAEQVLTSTPLRSIRLREFSQDFQEVRQAQALHKVPFLSLKGSNAGSLRSRRLLGHVVSPRLQGLDLGNNGMIGTAVIMLWNELELPQLQHVNLRYTSMSNRTLASFLSSALPQQLKSLDLSGHYSASLSIWGHLWNTAWNQHFHMLCLAACSWGQAATEALFTTPHLSGLRLLDINSCAMENLAGGFRLLKERQPFPNLVALDLSFIPLSIEAVEALAEALPTLPHLRFLNLQFVGPQDQEPLAAALARVPEVFQPHQLLVGGNRISPAAMNTLRDRYGSAVRFEVETLPLIKQVEARYGLG